jgi:peroxiredoxin
MKAKMLRTALCLFAGMLVVSCAAPPERAAAPRLKAAAKRKTAPGFSLKDANGQPVALADMKGKVVMLNFWATWCGPCKVEIPWLIDFEQRFRDQGFAVVGISMDDDGWESVKPYLATKKVNYRVVIGDEKTAEIYGGVDSLPSTFLVDREGRVASIHVGLVSKSDYEAEIVELLKEGRTAVAPAAVAAPVRSKRR